ncbi:FAD-dependent oxidoreductase [Sinomicrobium soli]|uniref:FAD-dependent oxidoreductase n=1 Tax=Sinomicrobium sp. N-1-3-6 TaxID=2219864 RepID=UPI000DCDCCF0|nr:FAD-dependent oxidoreductase [Sinomicrobium sp. N-1-3-6]RAV28627.1 xanthan lyase [Sinomicrobium sp. N-1-3-6]
MKTKFYILLFVISIATGCTREKQAEPSYDLVVYGSTSAGIIAAYTAKMKGLEVLLVSPDNHLGGLTTGGLGYTDIGNKYAITGLARDFYRRIGAEYGVFERWIFEPHTASGVFNDYLEKADVPVLYGYQLEKVEKEGASISAVLLRKGNSEKSVGAGVFIDATYEGDLMAGAGVSYTIGRESNETYGETYNGVQLRKRHQFPDLIDPYKIKGDPSSGLLWGISPEKVASDGTGDQKLQAYNFRICLTNDKGNQVPVTEPEDYDASRYELLLRLFEAQPDKRKLNDYFIWSKMPGGKTDINNRGGFSTDMIGMNYDYPEASYEEREDIVRAHENYTKGLLYFYKTDPRVPEELRMEMQEWGYPKDEYTDNGNWSPQLYVREVRRMVGQTVMTQHHCVGEQVVNDPVALAAYTMDSHNCQRIVVEKEGVPMVKNEGNVEIGGFGPYPIGYGAIVPKEEECDNLLVPVCLSASHIAYGSIRMEPVFMALGQVAALAAAEVVNGKTTVQSVDYRNIRKELQADPLSDGSQPEILVDNTDENVTVEGDWKTVSGNCYGQNALEIGGKGKVTFSPLLRYTGTYEVFVYFSKIKGIAPGTTVEIHAGSTPQQYTIVADDVEITGQTSGEWISAGTFSLEKEQPFEVTIYGNVKGKVRADAVLLVPQKDIAP